MKKQSHPTKKRRSVLFLPALIVVLFLAFSIRFVETAHDGMAWVQAFQGTSFSQAIAEDATESEPSSQKNNNVFAPPPVVSDRNFLDEEVNFSSGEVEILQSLSKRRDNLEKREQLLDQREALLTVAEQQIDNKMKELASLRGEIEELLGKQQSEQEDRIKSLVKMYETMKAKDAARIFDTLEMDVLLSVMSRMSERKAAPVLAQMSAERAQTVTIKLAEQKQLPTLPKEEQ